MGIAPKSLIFQGFPHDKPSILDPFGGTPMTMENSNLLRLKSGHGGGVGGRGADEDHCEEVARWWRRFGWVEMMAINGKWMGDEWEMNGIWVDDYNLARMMAIHGENLYLSLPNNREQHREKVVLYQNVPNTDINYVTLSSWGLLYVDISSIFI